MAISKIALVNGAYSTLRISGITTSPSPEDIRLALDTADDVAMMLLGRGLNISWNDPDNYGESDPNDDSGIAAEIAGSMKHVLAFYLCTAFGKSVSTELAAMYSGAIEAIAHWCVIVPDSSFPCTLPVGNANAWVKGNSFYPEKNEDPFYAADCAVSATNGYTEVINDFDEGS